MFARDPDTILTLTKHQEEGAFTVDATLRNNPPIPQFVVRWEYPLMRRDRELDPSKLKRTGGRKAEYSPEDLLEWIEKPLSTSEWQKRADEESGMSKRTFYRLYKELKTTGTIVEQDDKWSVVSEVPNQSNDTN